MAVSFLEYLPEARPRSLRVPPASTGGHEIMLIKHISSKKKEKRKQHRALAYLYGRCLRNVVKYFSAKMHDDRVIRGIQLSELDINRFF